METSQKPSKLTPILEKAGILVGLLAALWLLYSFFIEGPSIANREPPDLPANLNEILQDPAYKSAGASLYVSTCAVCHNEDGGGLTGPNLTDAYWLGGDGSPQHIHTTIAKGQSGGMPSWMHKFDEKELLELTVYVHSLKGTSPRNPKIGEGKKYP